MMGGRSGRLDHGLNLNPTHVAVRHGKLLLRYPPGSFRTHRIGEFSLWAPDCGHTLAREKVPAVERQGVDRIQGPVWSILVADQL